MSRTRLINFLTRLRTLAAIREADSMPMGATAATYYRRRGLFSCFSCAGTITPDLSDDMRSSWHRGSLMSSEGFSTETEQSEDGLSDLLQVPESSDGLSDLLQVPESSDGLSDLLEVTDNDDTMSHSEEEEPDVVVEHVEEVDDSRNSSAAEEMKPC